MPLIVRFSHFSVQEYLLKAAHRSNIGRIYALEETVCHTFLADCCISYLLRLAESVRLSSDGNSLESHSYKALREDAPLAYYVRYSWTHHYEAAGKSRLLITHQRGMDTFKLSSPDICQKLEALDIEEYNHSWVLHDMLSVLGIDLRFSPALTAAVYRHNLMILKFLAQPGLDAGRTDKVLNDVLIYSCLTSLENLKKGHIEQDVSMNRSWRVAASPLSWPTIGVGEILKTP